ncbi:MAG: N(G),N(G)-dimethylarginine dimethylaminohydrolase [Actinomycetia bacterium]|nr:N(G),N(G)-dimethylarginine dimethylaminohydrolase [Actinomycetes bacterium]
MTTVATGVGRALVRRPSPRLAEGIVTHIERKPVDAGRATVQWAGYVDALAQTGWEVVEVDTAHDSPDGVFIEDAVVVFGDLAVLCRPGAEARRAELPGVRLAAEQAGLTVVAIEAPGTLDGGDVLKVGPTVYVGQGGRTNSEGIARLGDLLGPQGLTVIAVPLTKVLHLKSAVTALPDGTVIGYEPLVDDPSVFPEFLAVPEERGAHVVLLDENRVLMASGCPGTGELLRARGLEPITVDISEFEKLEGCVTCLSVRIR